MKRVLITGAGQRVGKALAQGLAADGWHVIIHYNRSADAAEALANDLGNASTVGADLATQDVANLMDRAGPVDALINNASIFQEDTAQDFTPETYALNMAVNLYAPLFLAREAAGRGASCIVNMIDQRVLKPNPLYFSYSLSKAGLYWATKTLAQSLAPDCRVVGIGPGPTLRNTDQADGEFEAERDATLTHAGSPPNTILHAARYLLSAKAVTGQMIAVDGGQHLLWETDDMPTRFAQDELIP